MRALPFAAGCLFVAALGCGARSGLEDQLALPDASADSGAGLDVSTETPSIDSSPIVDVGEESDAIVSGPCPAVVPAPSTPCTTPDLLCEYSEDPRPSCRTLAYCDRKEARWSLNEPIYPCSIPPIVCPSEDIALAGMKCSTSTFCFYADRTCECAQPAYTPHAPAQWLCDATSPVGTASS